MSDPFLKFFGAEHLFSLPFDILLVTAHEAVIPNSDHFGFHDMLLLCQANFYFLLINNSVMLIHKMYDCVLLQQQTNMCKGMSNLGETTKAIPNGSVSLLSLQL